MPKNINAQKHWQRCRCSNSFTVIFSYSLAVMVLCFRSLYCFVLFQLALFFYFELNHESLHSIFVFAFGNPSFFCRSWIFFSFASLNAFLKISHFVFALPEALLLQTHKMLKNRANLVFFIVSKICRFWLNGCFETYCFIGKSGPKPAVEKWNEMKKKRKESLCLCVTSHKMEKWTKKVFFLKNASYKWLSTHFIYT